MNTTPHRSQSSAVKQEQICTSHLRILVIDDNEDAALLLSSYLSLLGHEVVTVNNGNDALGAFKRGDFQLVVTDIGMPKMDGLETARRIRQLPGGNSAYLVALSGWGSAEDKSRSREAGIDLHLVKPAEQLQLDLVLNAVTKGTRTVERARDLRRLAPALQRDAH
jgi:CheY-like chemotaxis protein